MHGFYAGVLANSVDSFRHEIVEDKVVLIQNSGYFKLIYTLRTLWVFLLACNHHCVAMGFAFKAHEVHAMVASVGLKHRFSRKFKGRELPSSNVAV